MGLIGRLADKAKDAVAGHLLAFDAERRALRISHYAVAAASHVSARRVPELARMSSKMVGDALTMAGNGMPFTLAAAAGNATKQAERTAVTRSWFDIDAPGELECVPPTENIVIVTTSPARSALAVSSSCTLDQLACQQACQ